MNLEPHRFRKLSLLIIYSGRTYEAGKEINWRDGMVALWFIVKYRFSSNYADPGRWLSMRWKKSFYSTSGCMIPSNPTLGGGWRSWEPCAAI